VSRTASLVRNLFCGTLAVGLIACGRVRRARRSALGHPVATALYFHKPDAKLFVACIRWLKRHGYAFVSAPELIEFVSQGRSVPRGAVWLSFDDGCAELLGNVLPLVRREKIPVTLFIPSGIVEGNGRFPWITETSNARHAITVEELRMIAEYPEVTIGSHTVSHANLTSCNKDELAYELRESRRMLQAWTGHTVDCVSYPYGFWNESVARAVRDAGYKLAVTTENAFPTPGADPYLVPRFSIADSVSFPELVCNIVGVWRPALEPLKKLVHGTLGLPEVSRA